MIALTVVLAVLVGISLGLLGGGGSILTVPLLAYVAGMEAKQAIATSLLVVGATSAVAAISHARAGRVQWRTGLIFGVAGMAGAYGGGLLARFIPGSLLLMAGETQEYWKHGLPKMLRVKAPRINITFRLMKPQ